jgi:hypothetical protein
VRLQREIAPPDLWVSWYALNERRPLGEFAIEYFPEVDPSHKEPNP